VCVCVIWKPRQCGLDPIWAVGSLQKKNPLLVLNRVLCDEGNVGMEFSRIPNFGTLGEVNGQLQAPAALSAREETRYIHLIKDWMG